jgi:hypothetical protein
MPLAPARHVAAWRGARVAGPEVTPALRALRRRAEPAPEGAGTYFIFAELQSAKSNLNRSRSAISSARR